MFSALFVAFAATATMASPMTDNVSIVNAIQQDKTPVKLEELPDAVKTTLSSDEYQGWIPSTAFAVTNEEGKKYFEIQLKNEDQVKVVNLDSDGKPVEVLGEES